jgi:DnaK suppressor protein
MTKRKDINLQALKKKLLAHRQDILNDAASSEASRQPVQLDQTSIGRLSRIDSIQFQSMALETDRRRQVELQQIKAALKRIDEDDFGECKICGAFIKAMRLEINPSATICIDCANRA